MDMQCFQVAVPALAIIRGYFHKLQLILGQCDLCGNATQKYPLLCSTCFEALPLFNQDLIQGDLLNWPAVSKGLPRANFDRLFSLSPYLPPFTHWLEISKPRLPPVLLSVK